MADPRTIRTRRALYRAVVELSAETPPNDITVAALTQAAGINRATFYDHYSSPIEVLVEVLRDDLDQAREADANSRGAADADLHDVYRTTMSRIIDHMRRHMPVYQRSITNDFDSTMMNVVGAHFVESIRLVLTTQDGLLPKGVQLEIAAGCIGYAVLGGLRAWLEQQQIGDDELLVSIERSLPEWWFGD
ncbi:TetR/AcrR family transcriptional regulator [Gulosibacter faecalis]|jgi:AcrR family transcriptional regulator|uniref:TetR/AcrR family transcriptional regulator n=1 Tax=Gulosibacter faecalis TaxID=272240 RepID=A0ABW5UYH9_9MICO|nr:TetR/AcrR family transcriptional regulator [Gulosibacter faecalis]